MTSRIEAKPGLGLGLLEVSVPGFKFISGLPAPGSCQYSIRTSVCRSRRCETGSLLVLDAVQGICRASSGGNRVHRKQHEPNAEHPIGCEWTVLFGDQTTDCNSDDTRSLYEPEPRRHDTAAVTGVSHFNQSSLVCYLVNRVADRCDQQCDTY